jgi:hypothetical protein
VAEHTPGRLRQKAGQPTRLEAADADDGTTVVCTAWGSTFAPPHDESVANARRIVALWNAMLGVPTGAVASEVAGLRAVAHDAREESSMYARGLAEGAAAEREACCRAVCPGCAEGVPVSRDPRTGSWFHGAASDLLGTDGCAADAIRRRAGEDGR